MHHDKIALSRSNCTAAAGWWRRISALRAAAIFGYPVFYPRDNTSGCTKEAQAFTAHQEAFEKLDIKIVGISKDSVKSHDKFVEKQALGMPLLSDEEGDICEQFGVWKEKSMYGKTYFGIERSTFLIDGSGQVVQEWRKVKVAGHVEAVLAAAQTL